MIGLAQEISLKNLLGMELSIPVYQRPYKWTTEHTEALLNDIYKAMNERENIPYVMGTIIASNNLNTGKYEIVDGQQRLTTLSILLYVLKCEFSNGLLNQEYRHVASKKNIIDNAAHISNWLYKKNIDEDGYLTWIKYLSEKLYFVLVIPRSMDDAFVFFDSQNSKGKRLEDYDLLKASHLRCIPKETGDLTAIRCSQQWEKLDKKNVLLYLLHNLWGRTRTISRKDPTEVQIKREFKAIDSLSKEFSLNNYIQPPLFSGWNINTIRGELIYITKAKCTINGNGSISILSFGQEWMPFQITKTIESGELFFLFTEKYYNLYDLLFQSKNNDRIFRNLYVLLSEFNNTGIGFLLEAFEASLIFYFDKFGDNSKLDEVAMWLEHVLFYKRLEMYSLRYNTVNNHLLSVNPFEVIDLSSSPLHVIDKLMDISEKLYQKNNVLGFNLAKGIRRDYYKSFYGDKGFYRKIDVGKHPRLFNAKNMLIKLDNI